MITTTVGNTTYHTPEKFFALTSGEYLHCTFGRMNPPTTAHLDMMAQMVDQGDAITFLSQTVNEKNPLTFERRSELLDRVVWDMNFRAVKNLFDAMDVADSRCKLIEAKGIIWWCGSDRLADFKRLWLYPERWQSRVARIVEVHRLPDDNRSATAMRTAALNSDYETFKAMAGIHVEDVPLLFEEMRSLLNGSLESKTKTTK